MNSLKLNRPLVIMMLGVPGAGKSYFASRFSDVFRSPLVSFDQIHKTLFNDLMFSREEESMVASVMKLQIDELLKSGSTFIIDGGVATQSVRRNISQNARDLGYDTLTIWVQTDLAAAKKRVSTRSEKRKEDSYQVSMSKDVFDKFAQRLTPPNERERHIVISGRHTFSTQAKTVLKSIVPRSDSDSAHVNLPSRKSVPIVTHERPDPKRSMGL